jgi:hypothetical protein
MAQVVECFLSKHEVLSSYCYTHKKKKKKKKKRKKKEEEEAIEAQEK